MTWNRCRGTKLSVFSGKAGRLNRVILLVLRSKKSIAKYDVFLIVRSMKDFRHTDSKTIYRRMDALDEDGYITQAGTRPAKVLGESTLYEITQLGKAALKLDQKSIENFLKTATQEKLAEFNDLYD